MGANDAAEMLEAAKAENLRLEQALTAIRDLMQPGRTLAILGIEWPDQRPLTEEDRQAVMEYSHLRTADIREILATAGYPVTYPSDSAETLVALNAMALREAQNS
jgi:hypothetical protein